MKLRPYLRKMQFYESGGMGILFMKHFPIVEEVRMAC